MDLYDVTAQHHYLFCHSGYCRKRVVPSEMAVVLIDHENTRESSTASLAPILLICVVTQIVYTSVVP